MGGVTTVLDMPNTVPPTSTAGLLRQKQQLADGRVYCNIGFFGLLAQDNLAELAPMSEAGAIGFKCFLGQSTGNLPPPDDGVLLEALAEAKRLGLRCAFHAENDAILRQRATQLRASGRADALAHIEARPVVAEVEAIQRVVLFARETGAAVHILHVSSRDGLAVIEAAQAAGIDITYELTPHHALLTAEDMQRLGALLRINPPVREPGHAAALLAALQAGRVTYVATDHSPHTLEEKQRESIWDAVSGFPGVETSLKLMLTYGGLGLPDIARLMSEAPARTWGLYPRKGALRVGSDADLTVVDLEIEGRIDAAVLHSKHKFTPFDGMPTRGAAVATIVGGTIVMQDGNLCSAPHGELVRPTRQTTQP
jgi:dihydroorotase